MRGLLNALIETDSIGFPLMMEVRSADLDTLVEQGLCTHSMIYDTPRQRMMHGYRMTDEGKLRAAVYVVQTGTMVLGVADYDHVGELVTRWRTQYDLIVHAYLLNALTSLDVKTYSKENR